MALNRLVTILLAATLLAGCALAPFDSSDSCKAEIDRLKALLAAETAERQRASRAAGAREAALRRQLDALKAIERDILDREDRMRSEAR